MKLKECKNQPAINDRLIAGWFPNEAWFYFGEVLQGTGGGPSTNRPLVMAITFNSLFYWPTNIKTLFAKGRKCSRRTGASGTGVTAKNFSLCNHHLQFLVQQAAANKEQVKAFSDSPIKLPAKCCNIKYVLYI